MSRYYKNKSRNFHVQKASGEYQKFSKNKLKRSLIRSGLAPRVGEKIASEVYSKLDPTKASTKDVYKQAYKLVRGHSHEAAINYSLKKAIFALGPSGYNFEKFVARIFEEQGFKTQVDQVLKGKCVSHEVDVVATSSDKNIFVECKFHQTQGVRNDVKLALYIHARAQDLAEGNDKMKHDEYWIFSNTTFSTDAITYGTCRNLKLIGINSSEEYNLPELLQKYNLYPITSLTSLRRYHLNKLIDKKLLAVKDLIEREDILFSIGLTEAEVTTVMTEVLSIINREFLR